MVKKRSSFSMLHGFGRRKQKTKKGSWIACFPSYYVWVNGLQFDSRHRADFTGDGADDGRVKCHVPMHGRSDAHFAHLRLKQLRGVLVSACIYMAIGEANMYIHGKKRNTQTQK